MDNDESRSQAGPGRAQLRHPAELQVGVVGAGRAGTALAAALARAGHRVVAASAVSDTSVRRIRAALPDTPIRRPEQVVAEAGLVLLTVPDDALAGLVSGLASDRRRAGGPPAGARQRPARPARAGAGHRAGCAAAGTAPGDDVHRPARRCGQAGRRQLRGKRARAAPAGGRGPGAGDGRRAGVHPRRAARAVPRGPGQRGQLPGHAGGPGGRPAPGGRGRRPGPDARPAAVRGTGQLAAAGRRRADRAGRPRRRRDRGRSPGRAAHGRAAGAARLPGPGPAHRGPRAGRRPAAPARRPPAARCAAGLPGTGLPGTGPPGADPPEPGAPG